MRQRLGLGILLGLAMLLMVPAVSSAQSAIVGLLTDDSGGVLPACRLKSSSPVMIEGSKTDGDRQPGPLPLRGDEARHLQADLLAHRLRHSGARRRGPALELHCNGERRDESRLARRDDQRVRHRAAGRCAAGDAHDCDRARCHRLAADLAQCHGPRGDCPRRAARTRPIWAACRRPSRWACVPAVSAASTAISSSKACRSRATRARR